MMKILKSRTNQTIALMFLIGGIEAVASFIPDVIETPLLGVLAVLATYFRMNPSQKYE